MVLEEAQVRKVDDTQGLDKLEAGVIELPFPHKILWPNGRGHHMAKHREFQKHKQWAFNAMLAHMPRCYRHNGKRIEWSAVFYPKTANAIDDDNARASLKAYQDGMALALGIDDKLFDAPTIHFGQPVKGGRVVVTLS